MKFTAKATGEGRASRVRLGRHHITFDMPPSLGGNGLGPGPLAVFAASAAACVHYHASGVLARHDLPIDGLEVDVAVTPAADGERRLERYTVQVRLPAGTPPELLEELDTTIDGNPVFATLRSAPAIDVELLVSS